MPGFRGVFCLLFALLSGCSSVAPHTGTSNIAAQSPDLMVIWTGQEGGLTEGSDQTRATLVAKPLVDRCTGVSICIQVLQTEHIGAFSWPNGHIFVTRGLVDRLDDAELASAIAHEMGHLLNSGKLRMIQSDPGKTARELVADPEVRADDAGLRLLRSDGIPPQAFFSMLRKVEVSAALTPAGKQAIEYRLQHISSDSSLTRS